MPNYDLAVLLAKDPLLAKHLRLLQALRGLAVAAGKTNIEADAAYHDVQFAIDDLKGRAIRESHKAERAAKVAEKEKEETRLRHRPWRIVARLVRAKRYQLGIGGRRRASEPNAVERSLDELKLKRHPDDPDIKISPEDLSVVEVRAVELARGKQANARKNQIEVQAIEIAAAVDADLTSKSKARGHDIGLRLRDVIEAVLPPIEDLAGPANSTAPGSAMIAAVLAAVKASDIEPKPKPGRGKIRAAGMTRRTFDARSAATITWRLQRKRAKVNPLT
jgi:hypothetical protein